ncbi:unnamed protein product [Ixodes hexagonus]
MACRPRRSICFLKTHKCASSSVQNMMMRYGDRHNLSFVLPRRYNYLGNPEYFNRRMAPDSGRRRYDMLVHHSRFQEAEMRAVLAPDPVFVTIVREPASLFESIFMYYGMEKHFKTSLQSLSRRMSDSGPSATFDLRARSYRRRYGFNQMSFDLGFEPAQFLNASAVEAFVHRVDATFDLVMIAERMSESLVLLRHLLCWDLDDVVTFKLNRRNEKFRQPLNSEDREGLRKLNAVDTKLYGYFVKRLDERIAAFGRGRMAVEVKLLDNYTREWYDRCVGHEVPVMRLEGRENNSEECRGFLTEELAFTDHLRRKQQRVPVR